MFKFGNMRWNFMKITSWTQHVSPSLAKFSNLAKQKMKRKLSMKNMPGPRPVIPFIGTSWIYKPFGKYSPSDMFTSVPDELFKRYGPVYREKRGKTWIVHFHDMEKILKFLSIKDPTPIRSPNEAAVYYRKKHPELYNKMGFSDSEGEDWKELRMKCNYHIMAPSNARKYLVMNSRVADSFIDLLKSQKNPRNDLLKDIGSHIYRFGMEGIWMNSFNEMSGILNIGKHSDFEVLLHNSVRYFDLLKTVSGISLPLRILLSPACREMMNIESQSRKIVEKHYRRIKHKLMENESIKDDDASFVRKFIQDGKLDERDIIMIIMDLIIAGTATTSRFMSIFLHRLGNEQEVLNKLYEEIDNVVGSNAEIISTNTIRKMPYLCATVNEGYRCCNIIPSLAKISKQDVEADGFHIPAYTPIILETRHANQQESYFRSAHKFMPERWLRNDMNSDSEATYEISKNRKMLLPFGSGPRICLGMRLAQNNIHLLLIKILKAFHLSSVGEIELESSFVISPKRPVDVILKERN